jgi:hypothetical protein
MEEAAPHLLELIGDQLRRATHTPQLRLVSPHRLRLVLLGRSE